MSDFCNLLPRGFEGGACDNELLGDIAIESLARAICTLNCDMNNIRCTTSPWLGGWEYLFTDGTECDRPFGQAPCGSMVIRTGDAGTVLDVFVKTELSTDGSPGTWVSIYNSVGADAEFRVATGLPDPSNPSIAVLNTLFNNVPNNYAMVHIPETGEFWHTRNKGLTWKRAAIELRLRSHNHKGFETIVSGFSPLAERFTYTIPLYPAGSRIRCIVGFGYRILAFGQGVNPLDTVGIRLTLELSGNKAVHDLTEIRNGYESTAVLTGPLAYNGQAKLVIRSSHTGTYTGWRWEVFTRFAHFQVMLP